MTPLITILATITAIVILATKSVEFASAIIKYRSVKEQPTIPASTSKDSHKISVLIIWREIGGLLIAFFSVGIILSVLFSSGPATKSDVGFMGLAIILYVSSSHFKPVA